MTLDSCWPLSWAGLCQNLASVVVSLVKRSHCDPGQALGAPIFSPVKWGQRNMQAWIGLNAFPM